MKYVRRELEAPIHRAIRAFAAIVVTGPRRAGKTSLLRHLFPTASYYLLEDPDVVARLRADPHGFLDGVKTPAILDEVQNVPEVFAHVRARIDRGSRRPGQWLLTGSQEAPLMQRVTDSMAGTIRETERRREIQGAYNTEHGITPESIRSSIRELLQTVYERDYYTVDVEAPVEERFESAAELQKRVAELDARMKEAARRLDFEQAAELRDRIKGLRKLELR